MLLLVVVLACLAATADAEPPPEEGFHWQPHLGYAHGDHHVDLRLEFRWRWEDWKAFQDKWSAFNGLRTRFALDYRYRKLLRLFAQAQHTAVLGLTNNASGVGAAYRSLNGGKDNPSGLRPSQLFAELTPNEWSKYAVGRQYVKMGVLHGYDEPHWKFLADKRLSQRLVGSVGWTNGERATDAVTAQLDLDGHQLHAFFGQPTTGVFVVDDAAYRYQKDVLYGGIHWTAPQGRLLDNTELSAFFLGYSDNRDPDDVAGLFGRIEVYTLGASWLGVYPAGPGRFDVLLWGAFQTGVYADEGPTTGVRSRDQLAGAALFEVGYQLSEFWGRPWLRIGVNWGSGDGNLDDDDRHTFFNLLPTNHLYYGYLDQLSLQNLTDLLVQLKLSPIWKIGLELTYHRFWLGDDADFKWAGTGAFKRDSLGYVRNASNGSTDIGHELDIVASAPLHPNVGLQVGFSYLWGGDVFRDRESRNASFGYVQLLFQY